MPFIRESIVTTVNGDGSAHVAPLGVIVEEPFLVIAPFRPSTTLDNLRQRGSACVNYTTDVRVFAGCVSRRRRDWPTEPARLIAGRSLAGALAQSAQARVMLIDADLRRSSMTEYLGLDDSRSRGLVGAILDTRLSLKDVVDLCPPYNLSVIQAGRRPSTSSGHSACRATSGNRSGVAKAVRGSMISTG